GDADDGQCGDAFDGGDDGDDHGAPGATRVALLRFDVSMIPPGSSVQSARLSLDPLHIDGPPAVPLFRATAPWNEPTVTWNSFGSAFDPAAVTSASRHGQGPLAFDVTGLTSDWVNLVQPNFGVVIGGKRACIALSESTA